MLLAANAVGWAATLREPPDLPAYLAGCAATGAKYAAVTEGLPEAEVHVSQSALLRDIFGPLPFHPVVVPPSVLAWNNSTVVKLAQAIYTERAFDRLAILADALEDAGCNEADILDHLRSPGPHVRGCWPGLCPSSWSLQTERGGVRSLEHHLRGCSERCLNEHGSLP